MFDEFLSRAGALRSEERPFALAIVVSYQPPVSGKPGDKAIIDADGKFWGWIGGGCVQPLVVREALNAIADGRPRLVRVAPSPTEESGEGTIEYTMTCHGGGGLDIYIEPVLPKPQIVIIGRSPVAHTLCSLGKAVGYRLTVIAPGAGPEDFPEADSTAKELDLKRVQITPETYIVVSTQGEQDEEALEQACCTTASYVSFVASETKARKVFDLLAGKGISRDRLSQVKAPAGLDLGHLSPEEIALSVLAEIIQSRKNRVASVGQKTMPGSDFGGLEAVDPVCGMTVSITDAKHVSDYHGNKHFFCCAGCKQAFDKQPEAYLK